MLIQGKYRCINCFEELNSENEQCNCGFEESKYRVGSHVLRPGTILNNMYCVGRELGEGGFGITYVGFDLNLELKIAIKEFYMNGYNSRMNTVSDTVSVTASSAQEIFSSNKDKFVREGRILAQAYNNDGVVHVHSFFTANNTAYIVMEYLDGKDLKAHLNEKGKMTVEEVFKIFYPIMRTLNMLHERNLIHRDISPDNIIVTKDGTVKLIDFGAARETANGNKSLSVVLKHGYAPPEQYQTHGRQGPWTDVYALSATIYKCLTGVTPPEAMDRMMGQQELVPASQLSESCSAEVSNALAKGLETNIAERYRSMGELADALKYAYEHESTPYVPAKPIHVEPPKVDIPDNNLPEADSQEDDSTPVESISVKPITNNIVPDSSITSQQIHTTQPTEKLENEITQSIEQPAGRTGKSFGKVLGIIALVLVLFGIIGAGIGIGVKQFANTSQGTSKGSSTAETEDGGDKASDGKKEVVSNGHKIGISLPTKDLQRWNGDGSKFYDQLSAEGYSVVLNYASNDVQTQIDQINEMIDSKCEVLIIAAVYSDGLTEVLEKAQAEGIKVISYDRLIMNSDAVSYYVTFDNYIIGTLQGQYIVDTLDLEHNRGPFNLEITAGDSGDSSAEYFYNGAMDILGKYLDNGTLNIVSGQRSFEEVSTPSWSTEIAQTRAASIINTYIVSGAQIDAWLCSNDTTAMGVIDALVSQYNRKYPIVTGQDCDLSNVRAIRGGKQTMSVFKNPETLITQIVKMTDQIIAGEAVDVNDTVTYDNGKGIIPTYLCEPIVVDLSNYEEVLIEGGYYTENQLQ